MFEVFFSRISAVLFFSKILANKGNIFRKPYHILRNLQKLSEFPPNDFFGFCASVKKHSGQILWHIWPPVASQSEQRTREAF